MGVQEEPEVNRLNSSHPQFQKFQQLQEKLDFNAVPKRPKIPTLQYSVSKVEIMEERKAMSIEGEEEEQEEKEEEKALAESEEEGSDDEESESDEESMEAMDTEEVNLEVTEG